MLIPENRTFTLTCVTDEGNPTATVIWTVNGQSISYGIVSGTINNNFNALKTTSTLTATSLKAYHKKVYQCKVEGTTIIKEYILQVSCMYIIDLLL
jgi:hypothetical protein